MKAFEGLSLTNGLSNISQGNTSCENTQFFQHTAWQLHLTRTDEASFPHCAAPHYSGYTAHTSEIKLVILWMKHLSLICWVLNIWIKKNHGHAFFLFKWKRDLNVNLMHQLHIFIWFTVFTAKTGGKAAVPIRQAYFRDFQWLILLDLSPSLFTTLVLTILSWVIFWII